MPGEPITVVVDPEVANAYRSASDDERRKLDLLVSLRLRDATRSKESLKEVMRQVSKNAQERGLTPEILQSSLTQDDAEC
ncbi:MAG: hypothetical protein GXP27_02850 [Planctomycetes bacterium]|nr:hypothetical protein [Planctomycetota bacterium]